MAKKAKANGANGKGNGSETVSKPKRKRSEKSAGEQRANTGDDSQEAASSPDGRDSKGKFLPGNPNRFPPGTSGNPKGRPPKPSLVDAVMAELMAADQAYERGLAFLGEDGKPQRAPTIREVAQNVLNMAMKGNVQALGMLQTLFERLDGKVPAKHEHTGADGDAINIRHARDDIVSRIARQVARSGTGVDPSKPN